MFTNKKINSLKEKINVKQKEYDNLLVEYAIKKYDAEIKRKDRISNHCNCYMVILSMLIFITISMFELIKLEINEVIIVYILLGIILLHLFLSLVLTIIVNCYFKKEYLSKVIKIEQIMGGNSNKFTDKELQMFIQTIDSKEKINSLRIRLMTIVSYLILLILILAILLIIIFGRNI